MQCDVQLARDLRDRIDMARQGTDVVNSVHVWFDPHGPGRIMLCYISTL